MQQLSGLDASFLYLETDNAPMHIGGLSILSGNTPDGPMTFERLTDLLAERIHTSRTFTQKLVDVPLNLGRPYWVHDDDFDLTKHVSRTQLPEPGGWRELRALMSWEFAQPLERDRPLWQVLYIEGLDNIEEVPAGSVGLISKLHHAAIDGVSGSEIMSALFDISPQPRPTPAPEPRDDGTIPSPLELLTRAGKGLVPSRQGIKETVGGAVRGVLRSGALRIQRLKAPPSPFSAPRSLLNAPVSARRTWSCALLSLDQIRAIRKLDDVTVNDVVLTVCAGALRRYLDSRGELPEKPLIAMVPISVRGEDQKSAMGNQVSAMLVSLATDLDDPMARLKAVSGSASESKVYNQAVGARTLMDSSNIIPFSVASLGTRLYTRMELAKKHRPIFNLVITNVPGPQMPLYVAGAELLAHIGAAPVFDGLGLILPIFSYNGTLAVGATSCPEILPNPEELTRMMNPALDDLHSALVEARQ